MRSTMLPGRLNAIAILHEQKTLTDRLNLTDIAKEFVCRKSPGHVLLEISIN